MILAIFFLIASIALGAVIARKLDSENRLAYAIPLGIAVSTWVLFLVSLLIGFNAISVLVSAAASAAAFLYTRTLKPNNSGKAALLSKNILPLAVFSLAFMLSLNYSMFHYDSEGLKGFTVDFGFHKSIIASIANGNFPPQHPLFAGIPLAYYYFSHLFTAALMLGGFSLQWAFVVENTLAISSAVLLLFIFARKLFPRESEKGNALALLATLLVLLNGNFSFIEYFKNFSLSNPGAFFSQNFFNGTQQAYPFLNFLSAHLLLTPYALGLALALIVAIKILEGKFEWVALLALVPMFNFFAFLAGLVLAASYVFWTKTRERRTLLKAIAVAVAVALPQIAFLASTRTIPAPGFRPGWLSPAQDPLSIILFWALNLGIYLALAAWSLRDAHENEKRMLLGSVPLFILGNLFVFTPYAWDNVKLFLFFFIVIAMLAAKALKEILGKSVVIGAIVLAAMALTGVLSVYTIASSSSGVVYDSFDLKACEWADVNVPKDALFLTDGQHTCISGLLGRKVFLGDLEWIKNHGIDYSEQLQENDRMLAGDCALLKQKGVSFVYLDGYGGRGAPVNETFVREKLEPVYNKFNRVVYRVKC